MAMPDEPDRRQARGGRSSRQKTPKIAPGALLRGRFELVEEIGRGGLSTVYKARDLVAAGARLGDPIVALKIVVEDEASDPDLVALMHREARRLRDLAHPNIVRVYDMDVQGRAHFMVMEYLQGRTLAHILKGAKDHRLDLKQVDRLLAQVAAALSFAHSMNLIHADLKPGNVFIEKTGQVKLLDFNIAYPTARPAKSSEEDTVAILGRVGALTPLFASPERLAGATPSEGDDVFSLAMLTYIAIAGKRPFGKKTAAEALAEGLAPDPVPDLSSRRWLALMRGLALSDQSRTRSVVEFAAEFTGTGPWATIRKLFERRE